MEQSLNEKLTQEEYEKVIELQIQLLNTDYEAIKYAEGYFTEEEYAPIKAYREELREQIRNIIDKEETNETSTN